MADVNLEELVARLHVLELAEARRHAAAQTITLTLTAHEPQPGTWAGDSTEARCRYCGRPIWRDDRHRWADGRDLHCHARAAGAEPRD